MRDPAASRLAPDGAEQAARTAAAPTARELLHIATERAEAEMGARGVPGIAAGVFALGDTATVGLGLADVASGAPVTPTTRFRWCSITKPLTATLARTLVELGRLDLDAPIADALPSVPIGDPDTRGRLSLRHLLTHTTGFACEPPRALESFGDGDDALALAIASFGELRQWAPPGTVWGYCNTGYWLAAHLCARADDAAYEAAMSRHVLGPLRLDSSGFGGDGSTSADLATPHQPVADGLPLHRELERRQFPRCRRGSGGLVGSIDDLMRFAAAHLDGTRSPWGPTVVDDLQTPHADVGTGERQLLGWFSRRAAQGWTIEHDGSWGGFEARLVLLPGAGIAVGVLSNSSAGWAACRSITAAVAEAVGLAAAPPEADPRLAPERHLLTGWYDTIDGVAQVKATSEGLAVVTEGEPVRHFSPIAPDEFVDALGERLAFPAPGLIRLDERLGRARDARGSTR